MVPSMKPARSNSNSFGPNIRQGITGPLQADVPEVFLGTSDPRQNGMGGQ